MEQRQKPEDEPGKSSGDGKCVRLNIVSRCKETNKPSPEKSGDPECADVKVRMAKELLSMGVSEESMSRILHLGRADLDEILERCGRRSG